MYTCIQYIFLQRHCRDWRVQANFRNISYIPNKSKISGQLNTSYTLMSEKIVLEACHTRPWLWEKHWISPSTSSLAGKTSISWFVIHGRWVGISMKAAMYFGNWQNVFWKFACFFVVGQASPKQVSTFCRWVFIRYPNSHDVMGLAVLPQELSELELLQPQ